MNASDAVSTRKPTVSALPECRRHWQRAMAMESAAYGLICWGTYALPFQFVGMGQLLLRPADAPLSVFEMSFVAGGCCVAPLVLLVNGYWVWRCWRHGSTGWALALSLLAALSFAAAQVGAA